MEDKFTISEELEKYGSFVRINNINTHMWEIGSGDPVVFIHGFMGANYDWRFNMPELSKHFAVKAFDLPGFGYSDKPLDFAYTSEGYADFIKAYLDVCSIKKVVLVGNSMGGQIALQAYMKYPERVSALVLIDSGGCPGSVHFLLFRLLKIPVIGDVTMSFLTRSSVRYALEEIIKDGTIITSNTVDYYYNVYKTANARRIPSIVVRNMIRDEPHIYSKLGSIKCPVAVIWGAQDNVIPPFYAGLFKNSILNAEVTIVPDAGHMPQVERAKTVNDIISRFITKVACGV